MWIKYCGVADEFDMLHDKWEFLSSQDALKAVRPISGTFQRLFSLSEECRRLFKDLGFEREKEESMTAFADTVVGRPFRFVFTRYLQTKSRIEELSKYLEILRLVFDQRTVSDDVSQTIAGFPHSPERNVGNELVCLAADKVAESYHRCLDYRGLQWDKVISFIYPLEGREAPYLHGGFTWAAPLSGLFHISLSGESKYFVGSFFTFAHEMGHASMLTVRTDVESMTSYRDMRSWVKILHGYFLSYLQSQRDVLESNLASPARCGGNCILNYLESLCGDSELDVLRNFSMFIECMADLIGVEIGGPHTMWELCDFSPSEEVLFRIAFLVGYYHDDSSRQLSFLSEMLNLADKLSQQFSFGCLSMEHARVCIRTYYTFAARAGAFVSAKQRTFNSVASSDYPDLYEEYAAEFAELGREGFVDDGSIFSRVIRSDCRFQPSYPERDKIEKCLKTGTPMYDKDPRKILDVYYAIYREQGNPPSFSTVVSSLAFNKAPVGP